MAAAIRLRGAVSLLGRFPALAGVDLDVERGEIVHVAGPNGAGKSTLLRACAGLVPFGAGEAEVLGYDLRRDRKSHRRRIGLLGHTTFLYDDLTARENAVFASRLAGADATAVDAALARVGLEAPAVGLPVSRLSAGQRRRVALAVVIARSPELWLLDEPHAGLDAESRDVLDALIREVSRAGATVVLASHEHERARALASRSVVLDAGTIKQEVPAGVA